MVIVDRRTLEKSRLGRNLAISCHHVRIHSWPCDTLDVHETQRWTHPSPGLSQPFTSTLPFTLVGDSTDNSGYGITEQHSDLGVTAQQSNLLADKFAES